jgi:phosphoglycolate phosphatase
MHFAAVVFDLDGTLLDTLADIAYSANAVLSRHGFPNHEIDEYRWLVGEGVAKLFERALPADQLVEAVIARCVADFREVYGRHWNASTKAYEGIPELLSEVAALGIKCAVLSNKPDAFTKRCVAEYFRDTHFHMVLGQRDGFPRKPDPAGALQILRQLEVPAAHGLFLGDSAVDMQTARRAGLYSVGALWGFRTRQELADAGADAIIQWPRDLLPILGVRTKSE